MCYFNKKYYTVLLTVLYSMLLLYFCYTSLLFINHNTWLSASTHLRLRKEMIRPVTTAVCGDPPTLYRQRTWHLRKRRIHTYVTHISNYNTRFIQ